MDYDVIVIGAGVSGEAAYDVARSLGAKTAVIERELVGGECGFWACMPSKTLLNAAMRRALGADYPWERASDRRDWMISREGTDRPSDAGHVRSLESAGAELLRGDARVVAPGRVEVRLQDGGGSKTIDASNLIVSTGSVPVIPPIEGLRETGYWTSRDATSLRELPSSVVVMGGGPVGVEMAQVYVRFGVKTVIVNGGDRILGRDHPRSSQVVTEQLQREGAEIRNGVQAVAVRTGGAGRIVELSDGSTVEGAELLVAVGRRGSDLRALGLEEAGVSLGERGETTLDGQLRAADGVFVVGDAAGGLQFTHLADYEARVAVRAALGGDANADLVSVPKATYTDPETGAVGLTVEEAQAQGIDAFEVSQDFAYTAKGFTVEPVGGDLREGSPGHVTAVVDRGRGVLAGAFTAGPGASEYLHMAVLAIKVGTPVSVLADTIGAFPTGGRVMTNVFAEAAKQLS